jgi:DNA-binding XRE family transcriptional regulator
MLSLAHDPTEPTPFSSHQASTAVKDYDPARLTLVDAHIGRRIRMRRRLLGLNQTGLANRIGVTFQQVHKYETGQSAVTAARLFTIARALGIPPEYFFEDFQG